MNLDRMESEATPGALLFAFSLVMAAMLAGRQPVVVHPHRLDKEWIKHELSDKQVLKKICAR